MDQLVAINRTRIFSLDDAQRVLPVILRISESAQKEVDFLTRCLRTLPSASVDRDQELRQQIDSVVEVWESKISKLGAIPKGLWMADFDNGEGYWCWKLPEAQISHKHGYQDGFSGRKSIDPF